MKHGLKLEDILKSIESSDNVKTAADMTNSVAGVAPTTVKAKEDLLNAINKKVPTPAPELDDTKVAAAKESNPADALVKQAEEINRLENDMLIKEANFYGAAVCDGFMMRLAEYEKAAEDTELSEEEKAVLEAALADEAAASEEDTESEDSTDEECAEGDDSCDKEASIKVAAFEKYAAESFMQGYQETQEKIAEEAFLVGYRDAMEKIASDVYRKGYNDTLNVLREVAKS